MQLLSQVGGSVTNGLAYIGSLASLGGRAAYYTFVAPFQGKPIRFQRAVSQALDVGVRALPILSLITFFIGLILALQAAYELRRFGAISYVATAVAISMSRELGPPTLPPRAGFVPSPPIGAKPWGLLGGRPSGSPKPTSPSSATSPPLLTRS